MTSRKYVNEAKQYIVKALKQKMPHKNGEIIPFVNAVQKMGATLHTRYEKQCNGFPFDKDNSYTEKFDRDTDKREHRLLAKAVLFGFKTTDDVNERRHGCFIGLQGDPRGWPVCLYIDGREYRLGGKA